MAQFPNDWRWLVGDDESRAFSSATATYVPADDLDTWGEAGDVPSRIVSEAELAQVLSFYGLPIGALPPPPAAPVVSRLQFVTALQGLGKYAAVCAAVLALPATDPVSIYFLNARDFVRTDPRLTSFATAMNLNSAQVDAAFVAATAVPA